MKTLAILILILVCAAISTQAQVNILSAQYEGFIETENTGGRTILFRFESQYNYLWDNQDSCNYVENDGSNPVDSSFRVCPSRATTQKSELGTTTITLVGHRSSGLGSTKSPSQQLHKQPISSLTTENAGVRAVLVTRM